MLLACPECRRQYDVSGMSPGQVVRCLCATRIEVPHAQAVEKRMQRCASCGGRLDPHASSCGYCGGQVHHADRGLGEACPECFARLPAGAKFCASCGVRLAAEALRVVPADANCPRCNRALVTCTLAEGDSYVECPGCAGLWLSEKCFEGVVEERDRSPFGKQRWERARRAEAPSGAPSAPAEVRYLPCPLCSQPMHRRNYANASGVILDWCKGHGFWFDADELERILRFVEAGGLDKARQRSIEEQRLEAERWGRKAERERRAALAAGPMEPGEHRLLYATGRRSTTGFLGLLGGFLSGLLDD